MKAPRAGSWSFSNTSIGYTVELAISGTEALSRMEKRDIDLVIIDVDLPDINGVEVAAQLQLKDPTVPVVATGYSPNDRFSYELRYNVFG